MFNDTDVDIDERTEGSEWTIRFTNTTVGLTEGLVLDLVKRTSWNKMEGTQQYEAVMYQPDEFVGATYTNIEVPSIVTNIDQFLQWGLMTLRREAAKRYIARLSPEEWEMVFNIMNEQVDELFEAAIRSTKDILGATKIDPNEDFAAHEYEV